MQLLSTSTLIDIHHFYLLLMVIVDAWCLHEVVLMNPAAAEDNMSVIETFH